MCAAKWNETDRSTVRTIKTMSIGKTSSKREGEKQPKKNYTKNVIPFIFPVVLFGFRAFMCALYKREAQLSMLVCLSVCACVLVACAPTHMLCVAGAIHWQALWDDSQQSTLEWSDFVLRCAWKGFYSVRSFAHRRLQFFAQIHWWYVYLPQATLTRTQRTIFHIYRLLLLLFQHSSTTSVSIQTKTRKQMKKKILYQLFTGSHYNTTQLKHMYCNKSKP